VLGKRWSGDEAAAAGIVSRSIPGEELLRVALVEAAQLAKLGGQ
jgi:enoyl-CoA hydratase/carnithine racemase